MLGVPKKLTLKHILVIDKAMRKL